MLSADYFVSGWKSVDKISLFKRAKIAFHSSQKRLAIVRRMHAVFRLLANRFFFSLKRAGETRSFKRDEKGWMLASILFR